MKDQVHVVVLERLLGPARAPGARWRVPGSAEDERYADVAASLQALTERYVLALARTARELTGEDRVCLAGGVALNSVANGRLAAEGPFREVFVQPDRMSMFGFVSSSPQLTTVPLSSLTST